MKTMALSYDLPDRVFLKHKSKMTDDRCILKFFSGAVLTEKNSMRF